ncbi:MAG: hypothetical protein AAGA48_04570 [Myxococcota bacterium]
MRMFAGLSFVLAGVPRCHSPRDVPPCKGPTLRMVRKQQDDILRVRDGDRLDHGDLIQVGYLGVTEGSYGAILSQDGRGFITVHLPSDSESQSAPLESADWLDYSFKLDDAPDFEHFFFVVHERPFLVDPVINTLQSGSLDDDVRFVAEFHLRKPRRPPTDFLR